VIPFSKYSGAGNDFIVAEARDCGVHSPAELARVLCPRRTGVGGDGFIVVEHLSADHVALRFFNPDGSEFAVCGNGSRCAARFAVDRRLVEGRNLRLRTSADEIGARVDGADVVLEYRLTPRLVGEFEIDMGMERRSGWLVDIGLPHFVLPLDTLPAEPLEDICRAIRCDPVFGEQGTNVNLVRRINRRKVEIRTFERGVEAETLACGSGAMAAAFALHAAALCEQTIELRTRSGEALTVSLPGGAKEGEACDSDPAGGTRRATAGLYLRGPARRVFEGIWLPDKPA